MQFPDNPTLSAGGLPISSPQPLRVLVDMNLSPDWIAVLESAGHASIHWSRVGQPDAADQAILEWARERQHIVLTRDLDFGTVLALTRRCGPSVLQVRTHKLLPKHSASLVLAALSTHRDLLIAGALVVIHDHKARIRILPLSSS